MYILLYQTYRILDIACFEVEETGKGGIPHIWNTFKKKLNKTCYNGVSENVKPDLFICKMSYDPT